MTNATTTCSPPLHSDQLHVKNWAGSVPVVLTLAANSNSSPTLPPPIHVLVPRHAFLHVALQDAIRRLHRFAPPTFFGPVGLKRQEPEAGSMYKDEDDENDDGDGVEHNNNRHDASKEPKILAMTKQQQEEATPFPVCWFEDEDSQTALRWHLFAGVLFDLKPRNDLPWKIRLHFTAYPSSQILPLENNEDDVLHQVRAVFKNSLKQAMCLHYGNSKPALNLSKESHGKIWDSLQNANYNLYKQAHTNLPKQSSTRVPVRVLVDAGPPIQKPCLGADHLTLGTVLHTAAPDQFDSDATAKETVLEWRIAGLSNPPLDTPIQHYWVNLAHPDHFLYIIVLTK